MNAELFKSLLRPYWETKSINDLDAAADKLATAYHLSNIGDTKTFFGAPMINGDKDTLKTFLSIGMKINFYLSSTIASAQDISQTSKLNELKSIGFKIMSFGFCFYWINAKFLPFPPMPPMFAPLNGVNVLFPGLPTELASDLQNAFQDGEVDEILDKVYNALFKHLITVAGIYSGYIAAGPVISPFVLPWVTLV